jgi:hypothetical protein
MRIRSRRKRLILRYGLAAFILIVLAGIVVLIALPDQKPYTPGEVVEGITNELDRELPANYPRITFTDVAAESGIRFNHFHGVRSTQLPEDMGSGAAWGDYDNDGDQDLYVCNIAGPLTFSQTEIAKSPAHNKLYRNDGNGSFSDVSAISNTNYHGWSMGAAWIDFDRDGYLDLFVSNYGTNRLYHNEKDGTFKDVSKSSGISDFDGFWSGVSTCDYDLDGDEDVYVCGYVRYRYEPDAMNKVGSQYDTVVPFTLNPSSYEPERNLLFQNNGDGTFTETGAKAGVHNPEGRSLSASWADFNEDGLPDLYVANDISDNAMYRNGGNGKFTNVAQSSWVADHRGAMGIGVGDWNNDGDADLFITHWIAQENALFDNLLRPMGKSKEEQFTKFSDIADRVGLGQIALDFIGWGTSFFDYDNDGRQDLLVVNGSTFENEKDRRRLITMKNQIFWNNGPENGFYEVGSGSGKIFQATAVGRGAAFADYDNDGDMDVVIVNHASPLVLLRNDGGNRNHWLRVKVESARGNTVSGTRVSVSAAGMKQLNIVNAQSSYLSQNESVAHFGLGKSTSAEEVQVLFPGGKKVQLTNVRTNQIIVVKEPF